MSTHILNFNFEIVLRTGGCALEGHVFKEVCRAIVVECFVSGASVDPYADGGGGGAGDGFGGDAQVVVRESGDVGGGCREEVGWKIIIMIMMDVGRRGGGGDIDVGGK